MFPPINPTPQK
jgi:hypothetical protein